MNSDSQNGRQNCRTRLSVQIAPNTLTDSIPLACSRARIESVIQALSLALPPSISLRAILVPARYLLNFWAQTCGASASLSNHISC